MREALTHMDGVADAVASPATHEATVAYDAKKTNPERLAQALTDYQAPGHDFTAVVKQ